jgi:hypothetical protein
VRLPVRLVLRSPRVISSWCPVAAFGDVATGRGGGDVGVDADGVQLVGLAETVVAAGRCWPWVDVRVQGRRWRRRRGPGRGPGARGSGGVPAVLVAPGELQRDHVPGDARAALEPLPSSTLRDVLPRGPLGADKLRDAVVQVVRHGDRDQAGGVAILGPCVEGVAEFGGAPVVNLRGADRAQPHVAAGFQPAVLRGAVLHPDLHPVTDRDGAAVALTLGSVRVHRRQGPSDEAAAFRWASQDDIPQFAAEAYSIRMLGGLRRTRSSTDSSS